MTNCNACVKQNTCKDKNYSEFVDCNSFVWDEVTEPVTFCDTDEPD